MDIQHEITALISGQPEPKRSDMQRLHDLLLDIMPGCRLWFDDGVGPDGRVVTNPTIGYGFQILSYAKGTTREFFQVGMSANATGISIYLLGLDDRTYLARTFSKSIGKATISGYCIRFKTLAAIDLAVLETAIRYAVETTSGKGGQLTRTGDQG